jgi:hypothetical protein
MTQITTGPDGQPRFDGMTVGELIAHLTDKAAHLRRVGLGAFDRDLDMAAAALRHLSEWQPIETAPRDGTPVDLWHVPYTGRQRRMPDRWWVKGKGWRTFPGPDFMPDRAFTAWRHAPPPKGTEP